jgi:hypothetical protein
MKRKQIGTAERRWAAAGSLCLPNAPDALFISHKKKPLLNKIPKNGTKNSKSRKHFFSPVPSLYVFPVDFSSFRGERADVFPAQQ